MMQVKFVRVGVVAGLLLATATGVGAVEFFVAPTGDDANPGTAAAPFATLEAARDAVRASARDAAPAVVWLRGGDYLRTNTFALTAADTNCVYQAVPGEIPRLLGGPRLDPAWFTPVTTNSPIWSRLATTARGNVLEVDLAARGITNYGTLNLRNAGQPTVVPMELFVNGRPQELARWPNAGAWSKVATALSNKSFTYSGTGPERWTQAEEPWVQGN
jgi:hypothetical protein